MPHTGPDHHFIAGEADMILRVDHIAIAVKDYPRARDFFTRILGAIPGSAADDNHAMMYRWENLGLGDLSRLELLTPTGENSFLDGFLARKDGGVHHITLQTDDIYETKELLEKEGVPFFDFHDYGDTWKELFIHPRDAFGVLIQIAEFRPDDWIAKELKLPPEKPFKLSREKKTVVLKMTHDGGGIATSRLSREEAARLRDELNVILGN